MAHFKDHGLEQMLLLEPPAASGCTSSKHGLSHAATLASGDSGPRTSNTMLSRYEAHSPLSDSRLDKHGFHPEGVLAPGDLRWQILKTMLSRHAAPFISPNSANAELDFKFPPTYLQ